MPPSPRDPAPEDLFHLGIKLLVLDEQGRVLLLRFPSGQWDLPGGRVQRGEAILDTLARELDEETGLDIGVRRVEYAGAHLSAVRIPVGEDSVGLIFFLYRCAWGSVPQVRLSAEHTALRWATPAEAAGALQERLPPELILSACDEQVGSGLVDAGNSDPLNSSGRVTHRSEKQSRRTSSLDSSGQQGCHPEER
jgi:8-oxo-dGTP diphosphatase